jgi:branched-chain amino acid transport system substrate-binding protein
MHEKEDKDTNEVSGLLDGKSVSRRDFLKVAGIAGAAVGLGAGLGGALAACGSTEETTTTSAAAPATTVTTAGGATTTVTAAAEAGRDIKIGLVSPKTGALALFAKADDWWTNFAQKTAVPDGIVGGDGKTHKFSFEVQDSESDSNRAAQVAGDLISNTKVDIIMCSGSPDTVNPVADQAEALGCPCISNFVPWQPFVFGRGGAPDKPFKWTYTQAIGLEDIVGNFIDMWGQVTTNKKVGYLFANDADGVAWTDAKTGLPPAVTAAGYTGFLSDLYPVGLEDYTKYISDFKKNGCEICCGTIITPDFTNFWKQAVQQGYNPKVLTIGKALLFPQTLDAIGSIAYNTTVEGVWQPTWPYKDSITGKTCQELADDYMAATGEEWTAPIAQYAKFEWAVDVFKRVTNLDDKEDVISQVKTTKLDTCLGPIDFTAPIDMTDLNKSKRPVENVYKVPVGGNQWVKGTKFAFEPQEVSNVNNPDLPKAGTVQPMAYGA